MTKIHYGDSVITHLTTQPYKILLVLLIVMFCESCYTLIVINVVYAGSFAAFIEDFATDPVYSQLPTMLYQLKQWLIMCFIFSRMFETQTLCYFVRYQGRLKLQNLEVARDQYQRREKIYSRIYLAQCLIVSLFPFTMYIVVAAHGNDTPYYLLDSIYLYWVFATVFILSQYN